MKDKNQEQYIDITLGNGYRLYAMKNPDPEYYGEIYIDIVGPDGTWHQSLAIVRGAYALDGNDHVVFDGKNYEVLVYGDAQIDDITHEFTISLCCENE